MRIKFFLIFISINCHCQFKVFDFYSKEKIDSVVYTMYKNKDTISFINEKNPIKVLNWKEIKKIKISHVAYEEMFLNKPIDTIFLKNKNNILDEVVLTKNKKEFKFLKKIIKPFVSYTNNLGFNEKFVSLFKIENKKLKEISLEIINSLEVKNTKFLPFKIIIYTKDSITDYPNKLIYQSEILKKHDNKKYFIFKMDNVKIEKSNEYIFIGIEILDENYYEPKFIYSKYGLIAAVPSINADIYDKNSIHKTYLYKKHINKWVIRPCHLKIKLKYENY